MPEMEQPTFCDDCDDIYELNDLRMCFTCGKQRVLRCRGCDGAHQDEHRGTERT
jgi:hypothetical protein